MNQESGIFYNGKAGLFFLEVLVLRLFLLFEVYAQITSHKCKKVYGKKSDTFSEM